MELSEKIEEAIVAHLSGQTFPEEFDTALILPGESETEITDQCIVCAAQDSTEEMPLYSGNFWYPFQIQIQTPAGPNQMARHKEVSEVVEVAIMIDDLADLINAAAQAKAATEGFEDLADFTVISVVDRTPIRGQDNNVYVSGFSLRLLCCGSDIT